MKTVLRLLILGCVLAFPAWADPALYKISALSVSLPTPEGAGAANIYSLRDLALAKAAAEGLPKVLRQVQPSLSDAAAQDRAAEVSDPVDWLQTYRIVDESLAPTYTLQLALTYKQDKVNALLAKPALDHGPQAVKPVKVSDTGVVVAGAGVSATLPDVPPVPMNDVAVQLLGSPAQAMQLEKALLAQPHTTLRMSGIRVGEFSYTVHTPATAAEMAKALSAQGLGASAPTGNGVRVAY